MIQSQLRNKDISAYYTTQSQSRYNDADTNYTKFNCTIVESVLTITNSILPENLEYVINIPQIGIFKGANYTLTGTTVTIQLNDPETNLIAKDNDGDELNSDNCYIEISFLNKYIYQSYKTMIRDAVNGVHDIENKYSADGLIDMLNFDLETDDGVVTIDYWLDKIDSTDETYYNCQLNLALYLMLQDNGLQGTEVFVSLASHHYRLYLNSLFQANKITAKKFEITEETDAVINEGITFYALRR